MGENPNQTPRPLLSVVIPAFNEARRIPATLQALRAFAQPDRPLEVLIIDDGSTDGTPDVVRAFPEGPLSLRLLENPSNLGKGYSVRRGMLEARGEAMLMYDADGSTPIQQVECLLPWLEQGYGVVIGSREAPGAVLDPPQTGLRRAMARGFQRFRRLLMLRQIRDTQCGFKLFTRDAAHRIFERQTENGFAFDCEVLLLAEAMGLRIREVGVVWRNDTQSTVRPVRDSLRMIAELLRIRRRVRGAEAARSPRL